MRKILWSLSILLIVGFMLSGCQEEKKVKPHMPTADHLIGAWYSDRAGTKEVLYLNDDNTFFLEGQTGIYEITNDQLILIGSDAVFGIQKYKYGIDKEGNSFLFYQVNVSKGSQTVRLYSDGQFAVQQKMRKDDMSQKIVPRKIKKLISQTKQQLIGLWEYRNGQTFWTMEFKESDILTITSYQDKIIDNQDLTYEVKDGKTLIIDEMGDTAEKLFNISIVDGKPLLTINQVGSSIITYTKI